MYSLRSDLEVRKEAFLSKAEEMEVNDFVQMNRTPNKDILYIKEIRRQIQKAIEKCHGITVRDNGGAVVIPRKEVKNWVRFTNFIKTFNGISIVILDLANTKNNALQTANTLLLEVRGRFEEELIRLKGASDSKKLDAMCEEFINYAKFSLLSIEALENMMLRINTLKEKAEAYDCEALKTTYIVNLLDNVLIVLVNEINEKRQQRYIENW